MSAMSLVLAPKLQLQQSPMLLAFSELLFLPYDELAERVQRELSENPALERIGQQACPLGDEGGQYDVGRGRRRSTSCDHRYEGSFGSDEVEFLADCPSFRDRLLEDVRPLMTGRDRDIAEYVVGNLNDRGLMDVALDQAALELRVPLENLLHVIAVIREVGPPGIAAADARECILLQLRYLDADGRGHTLARNLIENHFASLARKQLRGVASLNHVSEQELSEALDFIRDNVRPYANTGGGPSNEPAIHPDAIIHESDEQPGQLAIDIPGEWSATLHIDALYRALSEADAGQLSVVDRRHVVDHSRRASTFIFLLEKRSSTLRRIVEFTANYQAGFVRRGPRFLKPLTRRDVARALELHESTISRAVAAKYAMLPSRQIVPLRCFFESALAVEDTLRDLLATIGRGKSDRELSQHLAELGHPLARRTVAKYRNKLGRQTHRIG
jgi:RNA polymerase sigma-54 factor